MGLDSLFERFEGCHNVVRRLNPTLEEGQEVSNDTMMVGPNHTYTRYEGPWTLGYLGGHCAEPNQGTDISPVNLRSIIDRSGSMMP